MKRIHIAFRFSSFFFIRYLLLLNQWMRDIIIIIIV